MTLGSDDHIVGAGVIPGGTGEGLSVLTVTSQGYGKRSRIADFSVQQRGGKGMMCHRIGEKTGALAGLAVIPDGVDLMLITDSGIVIRMDADTIPVYGRATAGVIVMRLAEGSVVNLTTVAREDGQEPDTEAREEPELSQEEQE